MHNCILELLELAAEQSFVLPISLAEIIQFEDDGYDDLINGEIIDGASDWFELSPTGDTLVHVWNLVEVA